MKSKNLPLLATARAAALAMIVCVTTHPARAAQAGPNEILKDDNTLDLEQGDSWVGGVTPGIGEVAVWDATVTAANTSALGLSQSWSGIRIANPGGLVTINGDYLMLDSAGIDMASATNDLVLNPLRLFLNSPQEWNIGPGRTVTAASGIEADGLNLTKTGGGTVRIAGNALLESLNILGGRVETSGAGLIFAASGVFLGGPGTTLALGRSQQVPPLFVAPGASGATLELALSIGSTNLSDVFLQSPLTIRRSLPATTTVVCVTGAPIVGGTAPGTDALIFSALNPSSPTNWVTTSTAPNNFTGNVRFTTGIWLLQASGSMPNRIVPDAALVTINPPAQATWAMSGMSETIDGLAGAGRLNLTGTGNTLTINANNPANDGARVFSGVLTQSGTAPLMAFAGSGTQVLAGGRITYGGATTITSGTLVLRDATAFASSVTLNGGTLELQSTSGNWTFGRKIIGGAGDLVKSGAGTVTLTAAASHTGRTTITGGTLELGAGGSLANTSQVVIQGGHFNVSAVAAGYQAVSLLGSGSVTGSVTVTNRLAIEKPQDVMNLQNLALAAGATAGFGIAGGSTAAALGNVSGQLQLNGSTLALNQLGTFTPDQKFTLFAYAMGNLSGAFAGLDDQAEFTAAGGSWRISYSDPTAGLNGGTGNRFITVTALPEPGTVVMLGIATALVLPRRRRGVRTSPATL